jgi:probable phosphoglycerate mutase
VLAERLKDELSSVTCRLYASELKRAAQMAQIIADATDLDLMFDPGLKEYNNGLAAGKSRQEADAMMAPMSEPRYDWRPYPQSETWREFYGRVSECMERLTQDPSPLLLVTHGGTINMIVAWWLRLALDQLSLVSVHAEPASLSVLRISPWGEHGLERLNDTTHLLELGTPRRIFEEEG